MADEHHYVFVTFNTTREQQAQALREIGDYVAGFLSQQPGFVQSLEETSRTSPVPQQDR
jgi:hypothetical protein